MKEQAQDQLVVRGGRCAIEPYKSVTASIHIRGNRITDISNNSSLLPASISSCPEIDLREFLIMPGLINAHDHLDFSLFPRLANPPYQNYVDWGIDIHNAFPDVIARSRAVPKSVHVWWGGIRNLLCGVTTVSHHNPLLREMQREDFPVRVIQEYGWAHSFALGGDLRVAHSATPKDHVFILHACEGVDSQAREELWGVDRLGILDAYTVLVHGLAIDDEGVELMRERRASLIVCPSSNSFLFGQVPDMDLLSKINNVALGNDSPLTAEGDLLDEIRFAMRTCTISPLVAYRMVTEAPAELLRLSDSEGKITVSGIADLIAVRDTGENAADRMQTLSMNDIEFVMIGGRVHLASEEVLERLPPQAKQGLEILWIDGVIRWVRAPVKELLRKTEEILGVGEVRLGNRVVSIPAQVEA